MPACAIRSARLRMIRLENRPHGMTEHTAMRRQSFLL